MRRNLILFPHFPPPTAFWLGCVGNLELGRGHLVSTALGKSPLLPESPHLQKADE